MSKKILLTTALFAGFAGTAIAADEPAMKSADKPAAKTSAVAEKPCPAPVKKHHPAPKPVHHEHHHHHHAAPQGLTVTLGGELDTQVGYRKQSHTYDTVNPAQDPQPALVDKLHKFALVNDTRIHVKAEGKAHGMNYGGKIVLNSDTSDNKYSTSPFGGVDNTSNNKVGFETKVWVRTQFGKLEAGSTTGSYAALKVSSANIARATGGIDGDAQYWWNPFIFNNAALNSAALTADHFIVNPNLPSNFVHGLDANSAKISYFTPTFMGFKAGVSYSPDSEQRGSVSKTHSVFRNRALIPSLTGYKNVWEGGLRYKGQFDKVGIKASLLGNAGDAKDFITSTPIALKRHDLRAWEAGAAVDFMGFTVAGSYGDWGRSGVSKTTEDGVTPMTGKKSANFWNIGGAYECHKFGASLTYMESRRGTFTSHSLISTPIGKLLTSTPTLSHNRMSLLSLGVDYKLAPGFMPYAEANWFSMKGGFVAPDETRLKNKGFVVLVGTKLHF
jgi:predicted porin